MEEKTEYVFNAEETIGVIVEELLSAAVPAEKLDGVVLGVIAEIYGPITEVETRDTHEGKGDAKRIVGTITLPKWGGLFRTLAEDAKEMGLTWVSMVYKDRRVSKRHDAVRSGGLAPETKVMVF